MDKNISFLQIFGIILVVLGHTEIKGTFLQTWIYSFHMPLFVTISGYLFYITQNLNKNINKEKFFKFLYKKFKRLLIPYFIISSVAYIPKVMMNKFAVRPIEISFKSYILGFIYPWDNPIIFFWFLPTIFIVLVLTFVFYKIAKVNINILFLISIFIGIISKYNFDINFLNISGVLNYIVFFILGMKLAENREKLENIIKGKEILLFFLLFILLTISVEGYFKYDYFKNPIGYYFLSFLGIGMSWILSYLYVNFGANFLDKFYGMSYSIYLFSWFPQVLIRILCFQLFKINLFLGNIISFIMGVIIPIIIFKFIRRFIANKNNIIRIICGV